MSDDWKDFLYFAKRERKGISVLMILILIFLAIRYGLEEFHTEPGYDYTRFEQVLAQRKKLKADTIPEAALPEIAFDINQLDSSAWVQIGLSPKQAAVVMKYKNKAGRFYSVKQLQKIWVIPADVQDYVQQWGYVEKLPPKSKVQKNRTKKEPAFTPQLFVFDPNQLGQDSLRLLGFSKKQAYNLIRYREAGGYFKEAKDLAKLYSLSEEEAKRYEGFVVVPERSVVKAKEYPKKVAKPVELNSADSSELVLIRGIGPYYAKLIIRYRKKLGGYHHWEQLKEIEKIPEETILRNQELWQVDSSQVQKLNINQCSFKEMLRHPYFEYYHVEKIFDYRREYGNFSSLQDLKKIEFYEPDFYSKVIPYLTVN